MRILILSLSRSGNTALYYDILSAMPDPKIALFEPNADRLREAIPSGGAVAKVILDTAPADVLPALAKTFDRLILLVRDPRDRLVSAMLFAMHGVEEPLFTQRLEMLERKRRNPRAMSFVDLVVRLYAGWTPARIRELVTKTMDQVAAVSALEPPPLVLRYEDYVAQHLGDLALSLGLQLGARRTIPEHHAYGKRRVKPGDWKNWFTEKDVVFFKPQLQAFCEEYGYRDGWALPANPMIPAKFSTEFVLNAYRRDRSFKAASVQWHNHTRRIKR